MTVLWQKSDAVEIDADVQAFLAADDVRLDRHLIPFDIRATMAHVRGLHAIDLLTAEETEQLLDALRDLRRRIEDGSFVLDERYEDGHTAIEQHLSEQLGETGRKVHLGRSRNDQVMAALRLWMLDRIASVRSHALASAEACLDLAAQHATTVMPGYTHMQRAVPSCVGLWAAGIGEGFLDDVELLDLTARWIDASPLGTAAGYGVNIELPRASVATDLGLARLHVNPLHAQNTRGKHELQVATAFWQLLQTIRRLAWDLSLFTTSEFAFVRLPERFTTGSSIMPNKRNPDVVELLRAAPARVTGCMAQLQAVLSLPSGYHRDLQETKRPVIDAGVATVEAVRIVPGLIRSLRFDTARLAATVDDEMFATDRAVEAAVAGVPFRDAYRAASTASDARDAATSLRERRSPGACGNLMLDQLRARLAGLSTEP